MNEIIQILVISIISIELLFISINAGYYRQKFNTEVLIKTLLLWVVIGAVMVGGSAIGIWAKGIFSDNGIWYSATLLFAMAAKYLYVAFKLKKARNSINPVHNQGMAIIAFGLIMNALFLSAANGLYVGELISAIWYAPTLLFPLAGLVYGIKANKFSSFRYEIFLAVALLLFAIIIIR